MNDFDQAARLVAELEPQALVGRLLADTGLSLSFERWFPTQTNPRLRSPEREADNVAVLADPANTARPWLLVMEFPDRPEPGKIEVLLEEAAIFRSRALWEDGQRYLVLPALLHLTGRADPAQIDMRTPRGHGLLHRPLLWDIEGDNAAEVLERVASGTLSWSMLFWVPLMNRGGEDKIISRWREVVLATVEDQRRRDLLREVVLTFAELARTVPAWESGLEGWKVGESQMMNRWRAEEAAAEKLRTKKQAIIEMVDIRFPGAMPDEVRRLIQEQKTQSLVDDWFRAAARANAYQEFDAVLRR